MAHAQASVPVVGKKRGRGAVLRDAELTRLLETRLLASSRGAASSVPIAPSSAKRQKRAHPKSKLKGVYYEAASGSWQAQIRVNKKCIYLGIFKEEAAAGRAYEEAEAVKDKGVDAVKKVAAAHKRAFYTKSDKKKGRVGHDQTSKHIGVTFVKATKRWRTNLTAGGTQFYLGTFTTEELAAAKYEASKKEATAMLAQGKSTDDIRAKICPAKRSSLPGAKKSKTKGVTFVRTSKKWRANVTVKGNQTYIGVFPTEEEAIQALTQVEAVKAQGQVAMKAVVQRLREARKPAGGKARGSYKKRKKKQTKKKAKAKGKATPASAANPLAQPLAQMLEPLAQGSGSGGSSSSSSSSSNAVVIQINVPSSSAQASSTRQDVEGAEAVVALSRVARAQQRQLARV